ncbi:MAG: hypothetical protein EBT86_06245 [Actinobacteria bacterium]|nr:hypothetical protein [Actinomycetota bacterium]
MICETTDFMYPLLADIYYPIVDTGAYGNLKKTWVLDKTMACAFVPAGTKNKKDVNAEPNINIDNSIIGRTRSDITISDNNAPYSLTNIVVANIRNANGEIIYKESAGARSGQSTLFEVATFNPIVGPFGNIEYYMIMLRRSENQAVDL